MIVFYQEKARKAIVKASLSIEEQGFPIAADNFHLRLLEFGDSLTIFPEKYPICHISRFAKRSLRCAVFEHNHIFIYKVIAGELIIFNIIHAKRLK